jgi:tRNA (guanine-N7-)-methyltransferase
VAKHKLARWTELGTFRNVIQPEAGVPPGKEHHIKGNWNKEMFGNDNPVILELGCGKGEYTVGLAERFPKYNYVGVDIKGSRMWRGARTADDKQLLNTAFLRTRIEFINSFFADDEVDEIWLTFPDPQLENRNSNKRLTCPWFLNKYRTFLKNKGIIHLKTDNSDLYNYTKSLVEKNGLQIVSATGDLYGDKPGDDILSIRTYYESIFLKEGHKICYLAFRLDKYRIVEDGTAKVN